MSEQQVEPPVQLGPAAANLVRSIWRQRALVVVGLVLGVALGTLVLPQIFSSRSTYVATVRMSVERLPQGAIVGQPEFGGADDAEGASTDALKDIEIATEVAESVDRSGELTPIVLLSTLSFDPVTGTSLVEVSYPDSDAELGAAIVKQYATKLAAKRNAADRKQVEQRIALLATLVRSETGPAKIAAQERLGDAKVAAQYLPLTRIDPGAPAVITTSGPPLSRQVTLALGLLLGLALGAGGALLVETAFPKVVTPSDAEEASDLPLVATVRKNGVRRTPMPVVDRPFSPAAEDYRRVGTALERQGLGSDIQVLAVASADPGDGKTMLAANLAHSLARQGRAVVLVSSDMRQPQVEKLLGLGQLPGLAEALQDDPLPAIALLVSINDHLLVLPSGMPSKHPGELLASRRLHETIQTLRQMGVVILDTPPARNSADAIALSSVADATLLVARAGVTRMRSLREATGGLRRDRIRQLGVVLVGTSSPLSLRLGGYRDTSFEAEPEEPELSQPRPVPLNPRPSAGPPPKRADHPSPNGDVTDLGAAERNRRAAE
ncbi:MAG TPA: CpsD/CapB family tyrosine-protein kinase [Actinomycetota bacterium]|nr:CpsD/CapB family tyrosine-protein kinase [Actinomycetota bacterium]